MIKHRRQSSLNTLVSIKIFESIFFLFKIFFYVSIKSTAKKEKK